MGEHDLTAEEIDVINEEIKNFEYDKSKQKYVICGCVFVQGLYRDSDLCVNCPFELGSEKCKNEHENGYYIYMEV